jgi:pyruvate dehydrogenase E2 component (dihydrolipoamide acetyltransferase)
VLKGTKIRSMIVADTTITVPDIGGAEGAEVVEVLVAVGDRIELEQSLIVLESDKASMEIPATATGVVTELRVAVGDQLSEGDVILRVTSEEAAAVDATMPTDTPEPDMVSDHAVKDAGGTAVEASATDIVTVTIPDIGTDGDVDLIEVAVAVGQSVAEGDSLVVLESDKASMEVPAPMAGTIHALLVSSGASVREGTPILEMLVHTAADDAPASKSVETQAVAAPAADPSPTASPVPASTTHAVPPSTAATATSTPDSDSIYAGPAVRKLAREFGIALAQVSGSGPRGRILKEDLQQFVANALAKPVTSVSTGSGIPEVPDVDFSKFGSIDPQPRSRLDKITAANMTRAWLNVPHVTQFDDADITDLEAFRKSLKAEAERKGTKMTPMPFILKACAVALNAHLKLKASLADGGETLVYKHYCHIGMAVDTPAGLMVPVIRDVDQKSIWEIGTEVLELAAAAKDKKLRPDQMQGGVFTVSSLGGIGGRGFTPIVNAPEVAILGVSRADVKPVWDGNSFVPRTLLPLSLSYDHRVINGGDAGRFLTDLRDMLTDIRRIIL